MVGNTQRIPLRFIDRLRYTQDMRHVLPARPRCTSLTAVLLLAVTATFRPPPTAAEEPEFDGVWRQDGFATAVYVINGTEGRNNPLRRPLKQPFSGDELFVRYRLRYLTESLDAPPDDEGEFFVLWLDREEGNAGSTHSSNVPNVGLHVQNNRNHFMVRYRSGAERFAAEVIGDREYLIVARLWKSQSGPDQPFDQLSLWVDPEADAEFRPHASVSNSQAPTAIRWIGISTGGKTEIEDQIFVRDIEVATTWRTILNLKDVPSRAHPPVMEPTVDFDSDVLPILQSHCFACHAGNEADIRLDSHDEVLNRCTPSDAAASQLFQMVAARTMPPEGEPPLSDAEIGILKTWINEGLSWNPETLPPPVPKTDHWAFQPVRRPAVPAVETDGWARNAIDQLIAARQQAVGIRPAQPADAATLARRMSLDMRGLPPEDSNASVDQLLNDPAHGVRWARHWLDVARWAESNGHQHNRFRPHAWRYRDWVVDALNQDLPYDQFLAAQIAGDELPPVSPQDESRLIATGFLAAARYSGNELDKRIQRNDILVDVVNTTANAFLGLTFECAQCHSHKFDPISLRDYYRLQAFFANGQPNNIAFAAQEKPIQELTAERWQIFDRKYEQLVSVRQRRGVPNPELVLPKTVVASIGGQKKQRFAELEQQISAVPQTWAFYAPADAQLRRAILPHTMRWPLPRKTEASASPKTYLLLRGDVNAIGPAVQPGWPLVFGPTPQLNGQRRTALAQWMTDRNNPLTARVWVNRIWSWHFGRGLVQTVGDFGSHGSPPSHPKLLDYLAAELMDHAWSTRHIHRLILNSATYRQSSVGRPENASIDPQNTTYWRWIPKRLEAEAIRDCMLAVSGQLDARKGGPSDPVDGQSKRRSLYLRQHRDRFPEQQQLFDGANGVVSCSRRIVSTNALQPLWLLNSEFCQQAATALADRSQTVAAAVRRCMGREPSAAEQKTLEAHAQQHGLQSACLVLLNSSEFLYVP